MWNACWVNFFGMTSLFMSTKFLRFPVQIQRTANSVGTHKKVGTPKGDSAEDFLSSMLIWGA